MRQDDARENETDYTDANAYADLLLGLVDGPHAERVSGSRAPTALTSGVHVS